MTENLYGELKNKEDLLSISDKIRKEIRSSKQEEELLTFHKRQSYLATLTSPKREAARKSWGSKLKGMHKEAKKQYTETAKLLNEKAESLGIEKKFDENWGEKG